MSFNKKEKYLSFEEARDFVRGLGLKSGKEWFEYCKLGNKPDNIPSYPKEKYKDSGWVSIGDWLGIGSITTRNKQYLSFEEARKLVRCLGLKSETQWKKWHDVNKPNNIPISSYNVYKNKGWESWGDFLGTGRVANYNKNYLGFNEAREFVRTLGLKSLVEWDKWYDVNKPVDIPKKLHQNIKRNGFL